MSQKVILLADPGIDGAGAQHTAAYVVQALGLSSDALVLDVKKAGHRVKVILSRSNPLFVQRLFEKEIPEIEDRTIKIERVAREAGYRTKVAVSSIGVKRSGSQAYGRLRGYAAA